jgi:hypothetical protein
MAGPHEWQIVNDVYRNGTKSDQGQVRYSVNLPDGGNPLVVFGVRSVNAKLCSTANIRSLYIDPRCTDGGRFPRLVGRRVFQRLSTCRQIP